MTYEKVVELFLNKLNDCNSLQEKYELCFDIYHYSQEKHPEWMEMMEVIERRSYLIEDILSKINRPVKEYLMIKTFVYTPSFEIRSSYTLAEDDIYDELMEFCDCNDQLIIMASRLAYLFSKNNYYEAEELAEELCNKEIKIEEAKVLAKYYTQTRRYEKAIELCNMFNSNNNMIEYINDALDRFSGKKKEYRPGKKENIEIYNEFLNNCIGICVQKTKKATSHSDRINDCDYPYFEFVEDMNIKDFVAYDVETSGLSKSFDYVTEIGAIKVIDGKVIDSKQFKFQELIHPYGKPKKIPKEVEELTGITNEMVEDARSVVEVFNDFADFIGDNILVGYNNILFDSAMLRRAGRYAKRIITNKQIDLLPIARNKLKLDNYKLNSVAESFGIVNPQAHRAYADALTTARLFLELKNCN